MNRGDVDEPCFHTELRGHLLRIVQVLLWRHTEVGHYETHYPPCTQGFHREVGGDRRIDSPAQPQDHTVCPRSRDLLLDEVDYLPPRLDQVQLFLQQTVPPAAMHGKSFSTPRDGRRQK